MGISMKIPRPTTAQATAHFRNGSKKNKNTTNLRKYNDVAKRYKTRALSYIFAAVRTRGY